MYSTCAAVPLYTRTWNEREDSDQQPELLDEVTDTYGQKNHKKRQSFKHPCCPDSTLRYTEETLRAAPLRQRKEEWAELSAATLGGIW